MEYIEHQTYINANLRLEELIDVVTDDTPDNDPLAMEFLNLTKIIENYEAIHFPMELPTLKEVIELRMFEMKLNQKKLAALLETTSSRISEYLGGKREMPLEVAKKLHVKLNIDSDIILQS
ncbi:helix-turn-helix domain-containing protein [Maribacter sp. IgM3_T14_3]|uniref:helix-turn-helix domain-containing protein n=1 Tax=Maribacter sp. IgM3_T14_3 TaxID=3415140 RepID=UPI003C6FBB44